MKVSSKLSPKKVGKPKLPEDQKKASLHITMAPDLYQLLKDKGPNLSKTIEDIVRASLNPAKFLA